MDFDRQLGQQFFPFDPTEPVDFLLKRGVQRTYENFKKKGTNFSVGDPRYSIVAILDVLLRVELPRAQSFKRSEPLETRPCFYSSVNEGFVEFFKPCNSDHIATQTFEAKDVPKMKLPKVNITTGKKLPKSSNRAAEDRANRNFKEYLWRILESYPADDVQDAIIAGVCYVLTAAEDSEGPFLETFKKQLPLFEKLKVVYSHSNSIEVAKGCYSDGMAVNEAAAAYDGDDEDDFGFEE